MPKTVSLTSNFGYKVFKASIIFGYIWRNLGYFGVFCRFFFGYIGIPLPPLADPVHKYQGNRASNNNIIHNTRNNWVQIDYKMDWGRNLIRFRTANLLLNNLQIFLIWSCQDNLLSIKLSQDISMKTWARWSWCHVLKLVGRAYWECWLVCHPIVQAL